MFRFGKDMAIWSTYLDVFLYIYFASFAYIFQDITMSWPAVLFLEAAGHALSLKPLYNGIVKKNLDIFSWKFRHYGGHELFLAIFQKKKLSFKSKL